MKTRILLLAILVTLGATVAAAPTASALECKNPGEFRVYCEETVCIDPIVCRTIRVGNAH